METIKDNILDVTTLPPGQKHPAIFVRFDALASGEGLVIHNDHDPKPLYYQLIAERGNVIVWKYEEQGPTLWKVFVQKNGANE